MITKKQFIKNVIKYSKPLKINEISIIQNLKRPGAKICKTITLEKDFISNEEKKELIQKYFKVSLVIFYRGFFFIWDNNFKINKG